MTNIVSNIKMFIVMIYQRDQYMSSKKSVIYSDITYTFQWQIINRNNPLMLNEVICSCIVILGTIIYKRKAS